jgi:hypothetical protein
MLDGWKKTFINRWCDNRRGVTYVHLLSNEKKRKEKKRKEKKRKGVTCAHLLSKKRCRLRAPIKQEG